jgi:hypothetical protein
MALFFNESEGALVVCPVHLLAPLLYQFGDYEFFGIQVDRGTITTPQGSAGVAVMWRGRVALDAIEDAVLRKAAVEDFVYAELTEPRVTFKTQSPFKDTWDELITEPLIPYDANERDSFVSGLDASLEPYLEKWRSLKNAGINEMNRRFSRSQSEPEKL